MKSVISLIILLIFYGCSRQEVEHSEVDLGAHQEFNLQRLRQFSKERSLSEIRKKRASLAKKGSSVKTEAYDAVDYSDLLVWDLAVKEVSTRTKRHSYLVPIKGSAVDSHLADSMGTKGYSMLDFYSTIENQRLISVQIHEYGPDEDRGASLSREKEFKISDYTCQEYKLLQDQINKIKRWPNKDLYVKFLNKATGVDSLENKKTVVMNYIFMNTAEMQVLRSK